MEPGRDRINLNNSIPCVVLQKVVEKWSQDVTELILIIAFPVAGFLIIFVVGTRENSTKISTISSDTNKSMISINTYI